MEYLKVECIRNINQNDYDGYEEEIGFNYIYASQPVQKIYVTSEEHDIIITDKRIRYVVPKILFNKCFYIEVETFRDIRFILTDYGIQYLLSDLKNQNMYTKIYAYIENDMNDFKFPFPSIKLIPFGYSYIL